MFVFTFSNCYSFLKMDFKVTLTHGLGALSQSCVLIPNPTLNSKLEDLLSIDEKDLTYYGCFSKIYLICKGHERKLKVSLFPWIQAINSSLLNFLLLRTTLRCKKKDIFFIQKQVIIFQRWRELFDPFSEALKATILWAQVFGFPIKLWGANTV